MQPIASIAPARAGLLGNPSDGYGGKAIALAFEDFRARVQIEPADCFELRPGATDGMTFATARDAADGFATAGCDDGLRLMRAALKRFAQESRAFAALDANDPRLRFSLRYDTDIPRQVGLAGSSAIVVATLRALCAWFDVEIAPARVAELALAAELEDLGIAAGAMDRVIQAHGGLMCMDLKEPRGADSYQALDPALLPPLFVAWDPAGGEASGRAHGKLRARWLAGDPEVRKMMEAYRRLVDEGLACLRNGDADGFRELMRRNFEMRTAIFDVTPQDRALVAVAMGQGGVAKLCGSGGAVVGMPGPSASEDSASKDSASRDQLETLRSAYESAGFGFVLPTPASSVAS